MEVQKTLTELFDTLLRRETIFRNKEALRHTYTQNIYLTERGK